MQMSSTQGTSPLEGDLDADRGGGLLAISALFLVLCTAFVVLRFWAHRVLRSPIFLEDWLVIPAYVLMVGLCIDLLLSQKLGDAGKHQEWILENEADAMAKFAQTLFGMEILYTLAIAVEKTSILLLYRRIFGDQHWFKVFIWGMLIYIWLWAMSEFVVTLVQCIPLAYLWDKSLDGACIDQLATYRYIPIPNVIHDVILLALPGPMIWQLPKVSSQQKMALTAVFLIGSFGCIASMIRTYYMFMLRNDSQSDQTWQISNLIWTVAEPGSIFICACLPVLWPLMRRMANLPSEPHHIEGKPGTTVILPRGWQRQRVDGPWPVGKGGVDGKKSVVGAAEYELELLHGVTASEVDQRTTHHDHLYLGPIRYQVKQDPKFGVPKTEFVWDASRGGPARAV